MSFNYDMARLIKLPTPKDFRKLEKTGKIIATSQGTPEFFIANAKEMKFFLDKNTSKAIDRECGADRALRYYRKRYGSEGVTEVAKRYTQSRPFLKSFFWKVFTVADDAGKKQIIERIQKGPSKRWNG